MPVGCCTLVDEDVPIFKSLRERCCTDIICLLIFLTYTVGMVAIGIFSLSNGNINYIQYPTDYLNQFCGYTDGVSTKTKAFYPNLDEDLERQKFLFYTGFGILHFQPYTLCVEECPVSFSLSDPIQYGGVDYPGADSLMNTSHYPPQSYYVSFGTKEIFSRCLPVLDPQPALDRQICAKPKCTDPALIAAVSPYQEINCTVGEYAMDSTPTVTTAWVVGSPEGKAACEFEVKEVNTQTFLPPGATAESRRLERQFADFITFAFSVVRSVTDSAVQVGTMGVGAPFVFSFVWFLLLFILAGFIIYLALLLFLALLLCVCVYFYIKAGWADEAGIDITGLQNATQNTLMPTLLDINAPGDLPAGWYAVLGVIATILTILYVIMIVVWRDKISRCIAIVREVTKVFRALPFMVVWPVVGLGFSAVVIVYAVIIGGFIATSTRNTFAELDDALSAGANASDVEQGLSNFADTVFDPLKTLNRDYQMALLMTIHVVGVIWAYFIVQGAVYTTLSRSAAVWFFSHGPDASGRVVQKGKWCCGFRVVFACAWCIFSRHLGSIAFGAAILTIVTIIRIALEAIDYYSRDLQGNNKLMRLIIKCSKCCVWCLEKTIKFVTYFGFIFVAIEGSSFCGACFQTMGLWMRYPAQISVNKTVAHMLSVIISLSIPILCAFVTFVWTEALNRHQPIWAAGAVFILAYVIAAAVTDVFRCAIDTIFICAFKDLEDNNEPNFMSPNLQEGFGIDKRDRLDSVKMPGLPGTNTTTYTNRVNPSQAAGTVSAGDVELTRP